METLKNKKKNWVKPEIKSCSIKNNTLGGSTIDKEAGGAKRPKSLS